ncbi:hypothetical protein [Haloechinothrix salitolerans]|uniref:DNA polymerase III beta sliding clamp C-terminal domain-containing protein n=1 Tax=Haloechinothrix salitolerans TaxID=926830 RepID=A0ABW2BVB4_9PSEU
MRLGFGHDAAGDWVSLTCGDMTVITRPVEATFPDHERLVPKVAVAARADRDTLAQATARSAAAVEAKKHAVPHRDGSGTPLQVTMSIDPAGSVSIAPVLGEHADAVSAPAHAAEVRGAAEPMNVLFNAAYLRDALNTIAGETVTIQLATPTRAVVFTGANEDAYRHLLMLVRSPQP